MKTLFTLAFISLTILSKAQDDTKKVLFLGDSYTNHNDLPLTIQLIAASLGDSLYWGMNAPNTMTLDDHTTNAQTLGWIPMEDWDHIVLQEQHQLPALSTEIFETEVAESASDLCSYARENYECIKPIFFMTWAGKEGDVENCDEYPWVCSFDGQQDSLTSRYLQLAQLNDAWAAPVGEVWRSIVDYTDGEMPLYDVDNHHPKVAGTYLAAATLYTVIFGQSAAGGYVPDGVTPDDAEIIQQFVQETVSGNEEQWNINPLVWADLVFDTSGFFTTINLEAAFTVDSVLVDNGQDTTTWEVGDVGATIFPGSGTYYFVLDVYSPCGNITLLDSVVIDGTASIFENNQHAFTLYPNPVLDDLFVAGITDTEIQIIIVDDMGRTIRNEERKTTAEAQHIDVGELARGNYYLVVVMNKKQFIQK
ncbi:MAG: T9SS type A sorting domain-containing protein, partial [Flavobacteriales bacterium]|nr:T9SS type A sorting domain-containing protein [Flavobacteriales bacterium]